MGKEGGRITREQRGRREEEEIKEDRRSDFIHPVPLVLALLLRGLHLILRAPPPTLRLQIVSFVNTLSSRRVTPVRQKEFCHRPPPPLQSLPRRHLQFKAPFLRQICVHRTEQRQ